MKNNKICELLGIKYPIFQGAMAWISGGELAGAVSRDGGLGIIAGGGMEPSLLRENIRKAKAITSNPIGVNLMLLRPDVADQLDVCIEEGVKVVTTGAGNPGPFMEKLKNAGIKVIPVIPTIKLAERMEKIGADAVIVEGMESGGHVGSITTMALLPQIVNAVKIPVVAAGGIASGKQFLAALSMGAEAVQCGTIFLTAKECLIHQNYKNAILKAKDRSTVTTGNFTGHPVRVIDNKLAKEMLELEKNGASKEEIENLGKGSLKLAAVDGDAENGSIMAGQIAAMVNEERTTKEILEFLMMDLKLEVEVLKRRLENWNI
ncbi:MULTISPECIES: nitronate monooxygenase [Fusobacterium]|uniref:nitronate monooxygenase n=1 Tax=Fusobacterium TaxID=848 RepID=UPI001F50361D|nr:MULTISPECIES: nitronate monooxygenase [Fusobacterium]MDD7392542.1 nitronate monooxygenase [Fusobacteriaceae bacterium]MCI5724393.1 nitronate monooxygenase [Fusobacterium sp.]MCI7223306.1 nitronate monooxygenase [Fusobacterium sp.]MDY5306627.1 nitronate monooxygenase [Fusobacterium gastrosuis]MDY5794493.1 nitronate monooxygenase [Fusobacterium gastrosuis]